jgi:methionyl-tRNA synthetase
MAARYFGGELPMAPGANTEDRSLCDSFATVAARSAAQIEELAFNRALEAIWQSLDAANKYIVATSPFTLAKDPANLPRVAEILANLCEGLRVVADTLEPFMPATSRKILDLLNVDQAKAHAPFGEGLRPGHRVNAATPLFPRIEKKQA